MSKSNGVFGAIGKVITYILVVLLVLGIAGMVAYFALRAQGVTYYVEYGGERYVANGDGGSLSLRSGEPQEFSVKSLTGGEVNYDVKVVSNSSNNFSFTCNGKIYQFVSTEEANNDYSEVFALTKRADGFSLTIPEGFSAEKAVKAKFGEGVQIGTELSAELAYFSVTIEAGESRVQIFFRFSPELLSVELDCESIVF